MNNGPCNVGSDHYAAKLTEEDVILIREARVERERLRQQIKELSYASLAQKFGVSTQTVVDAVTGVCWRHVRFPGE